MLYRMHAIDMTIELLPRIMWLLMGAILFIAHFASNTLPVVADNIIVLIAGVLLVLIGGAFSLWSFILLAGPMISKKLVVTGPYQYVRHPMYLSLYTVLLGIGVVFFSTLWFTIMLIFIPVWHLICLAEEWHLSRIHNTTYREYKRLSGMYFPKIL